MKMIMFFFCFYLVESVLKLGACYIKKTIENKKLASDLSAATKKKDDTIILSSEETKNPFPQLRKKTDQKGFL
jgi:hypothetical protein